MSEAGIRATVIEPLGRTVVLTEGAWAHIIREHPEMARYERGVIETITHPIDQRDDPRPGRERYLSERAGPSRFLTVVVHFDNDTGAVVTAFGHHNER